MKDAALYYAVALGWRVFPVAHDGRTPLIKGGCHAASCDAQQVETWWRRWPRANIALACGPDSGVIALDVDRHGAGDGFCALTELTAEFGELPVTVESRTPNDGAHLLFVFPRGVSPQNRVGLKRYGSDGSRRVYVGLDVRSAGASICLPPSSKPAGSYRWAGSPADRALAPLPRWLLALMLSEPPPRPAVPVRAGATPEKLARYVCAAVDGECGEVARTAPGSGRNQRLFIAAARLGELIGANLLAQEAAEMALERAATECGLAKDDGLRAVRLTIASGIKRGVQNPREVAA